MGVKHEKLLQKTSLVLQKTFPTGRFFPRHVGLLYTRRGTPMMINKKGMADAYFLLPLDGELLHCEIEIKQGRDKQSQFQKNWEEIITNMGGLYLLVREDTDVIEIIQKKWPDII
jgi:hypothetical protein